MNKSSETTLKKVVNVDIMLIFILNVKYFNLLCYSLNKEVKSYIF